MGTINGETKLIAYSNTMGNVLESSHKSELVFCDKLLILVIMILHKKPDDSHPGY